MYGDSTAIRALARRLREQGHHVLVEADALAGQAEAIHWTGLAADTMRLMARRHAADLRACAALHDDAAEALERHAREVDHRKELIDAVERRVARLVHGAGGIAHSLASHVVPDAMDHWLAHFDPPPHGSKEWLDVHLPSA